METVQRSKDLNTIVPACALLWLDDRDPAAPDVYGRAVRPSLLQHPLYGTAYGAAIRHVDRRALIKINGETAGMVQILETSFAGGVFHSVILDMGPVWLPGYGTLAHSHAFFREVARLYPARPGRRRRIIPAVPDDADHRAMMDQCGFRHSAGSSYQTYWRDLDNAAQIPRPTWRGKVRKAEKLGVRITWDDTGRTLDWLLRHEAAARKVKLYSGPSPGLVHALARRFDPARGMLVGRALLAGRPVAGLLLTLHGPAATYLIGWAGDEGRRCSAQNLLLHDGLRILKQRGIGYLDLGGVNDGPARAVKCFKEAMGGEFVTQPGIYR